MKTHPRRGGLRRAFGLTAALWVLGGTVKAAAAGTLATIGGGLTAAGGVIMIVGWFTTGLVGGVVGTAGGAACCVAEIGCGVVDGYVNPPPPKSPADPDLGGPLILIA